MYFFFSFFWFVFFICFIEIEFIRSSKMDGKRIDWVGPDINQISSYNIQRWGSEFGRIFTCRIRYFSNRIRMPPLTTYSMEEKTYQYNLKIEKYFGYIQIISLLKLVDKNPTKPFKFS